MRTTINLAPAILENAKTSAAGRGMTLSEFVESAVRAYLSSSEKAASGPFKLHTVRGQMVQPTLNLDRTSELLVADDEADYQRLA